MAAVRISEHFGIVVRMGSLHDRGVSRDQLLEQMECDHPLDEDDNLMSFGPHFGGEAAQEFIRRLQELGMEYGDDFFEIEQLLPEWCELYGEENKAS
jgi:hypothetical protein